MRRFRIEISTKSPDGEWWHQRYFRDTLDATHAVIRAWVTKIGVSEFTWQVYDADEGENLIEYGDSERTPYPEWLR